RPRVCQPGRRSGREIRPPSGHHSELSQGAARALDALRWGADRTRLRAGFRGQCSPDRSLRDYDRMGWGAWGAGTPPGLLTGRLHPGMDPQPGNRPVSMALPLLGPFWTRLARRQPAILGLRKVVDPLLGRPALFLLKRREALGPRQYIPRPGQANPLFQALVD